MVSLTGIGGASLITPMLIFVFQVAPSVAVSSDVVAATLMMLVGSVKHCQQQTLDTEIVKWLPMGSVSDSLVGVRILHLIRQSGEYNLDQILLRLLGLMISLVTLLALIQLLFITFSPNFNLPELLKLDITTNRGRFITITIGAILDCFVGLTSVSSGSMFALVLIGFFRLDTRKLVGTDIAQTAILLLFTSLGDFTLGTVDWSLVLPIWLGSFPGFLLAAKICQITPQHPLRFIIYAILMMVSWKLVAPV
jgi:uncharacterized membrane protein YfcA